MDQLFMRFFLEEDGQDMIEYSLLITFIAIACMWFLGSGHASVVGIWGSAETRLATANTMAR